MEVRPFMMVSILVTPTRTYSSEDAAMTLQLREIVSEIKKLRKRRILLCFKYRKDST